MNLLEELIIEHDYEDQDLDELYEFCLQFKEEHEQKVLIEKDGAVNKLLQTIGGRNKIALARKKGLRSQHNSDILNPEKVGFITKDEIPSAQMDAKAERLSNLTLSKKKYRDRGLKRLKVGGAVAATAVAAGTSLYYWRKHRKAKKQGNEAEAEKNWKLYKRAKAQGK